MDNENPKVRELYELFAETCRNLKRFVYFSLAQHYVIVPLIILLTYFQNEFEALPYLYLGGPPDTGKTTVLQIINFSGFSPTYVLQATDAATCRIIHQRGGAFILDEAEILAVAHTGSFSQRIFRSGYKKQGGSIWVCDKKDPHGLVTYNVYGVKVAANTKGIYDGALKSRFITILMTAPDPDHRPRIFFPDSDGKSFSDIGAKLLPLSEEPSLRTSVREAYLKLKEDKRIREIFGRNFEKFAPLFAVAKVIKGSGGREPLFKYVLKFVERYIDENKEEEYFTDWPTMIILSVWRYVQTRLEDLWYSENRYFWGDGICKHIKDDLSLPFFCGVKSLGKLLNNHGLLARPEKRRVMRVRSCEGYLSKPAMHYHLDIDKLEKFVQRFEKYMGPPTKPPANSAAPTDPKVAEAMSNSSETPVNSATSTDTKLAEPTSNPNGTPANSPTATDSKVDEAMSNPLPPIWEKEIDNMAKGLTPNGADKRRKYYSKKRYRR